jgi:methanogenic corrinoid protein MtbC1
VENVESLTKDSSISDIHIRALIPASLSFNPNAVSEILLRATINLGFEETFSSVVFPFLRRIGVMWQTGKANTGVEHFITNILRGKLIAAIDSLPPPNDPKRKRALLFLPDNELHEMGLLFYSYLIRKWGHEVLYLGQATPFTALNEAEEKWNPDILVTGGLSELSVYKPEEYLHKLSTTFRSKKILLSGSLADKRRIDKYVNIYPVRSVSNLKTHF